LFSQIDKKIQKIVKEKISLSEEFNIGWYTRGQQAEKFAKKL